MAAVQDFFESPPVPGADAHPLSDPQSAEWERLYAIFLHLSLLTHIPIFVALVMWLIRRDRSPFIDDHGREAVNFQISLAIYYLIGIATTALCGVGVALIVGAYVLGVVGMILAAVAAGKGRYFRYPACIRLIH
jgi:uncharacterized Tic20 family protein